MIWHDVEQNTDEWQALRAEKLTTSTFKDLFAAKTTAAYKKAIYRPVYERLTGEQPESFSNFWTDRGHDVEPLAVEAYEMETFNEVLPPGFFELNEYVGSSPDGLIGKDGLLEIKSPSFNVMIDYLLSGKLPSIYKWQVYGQMYVTGRKWVDFCAFHPRLKPLIIRVHRDEAIMEELRIKLDESVEEVKNIINKIK